MQFQELQDLGKPIQHLLSVSRIPAAQMTILQFIVGQFLTELQQQKKNKQTSPLSIFLPFLCQEVPKPRNNNCFKECVYVCVGGGTKSKQISV